MDFLPVHTFFKEYVLIQNQITILEYQLRTPHFYFHFLETDRHIEANYIHTNIKNTQIYIYNYY
jgi:hypothetical protein